jgi:hypothetical protein
MAKSKLPEEVNKGQGPQPKVDRDKKLIEDYKADVPTYKICATYKISPKRMYEILDRWGVARNRKPIKKTKKSKK